MFDLADQSLLAHGVGSIPRRGDLVTYQDSTGGDYRYMCVVSEVVFNLRGGNTDAYVYVRRVTKTTSSALPSLFGDYRIERERR